ncbi:MAG: glycosyltransferase [Bacteroidia bacterium]|nr:glycosyltransferase [Bacteroidia bacterium]
MLNWIEALDSEALASFLSYGISGIVSLYWILLSVRAAVACSYSAGEASWRAPAVSILIPAHNAEETLDGLLASLSCQDYPAPYEVIIALDRCTDATKSIAERYVDKLSLRWVEIATSIPPWSPKKYALWRAAQIARYEWCIVADADVIVRANWLSALMGKVSENEKALVGWAWLQGAGGLISHFAAYEAAIVQVECMGRAAWSFPYMSTGRGWAIRRQWLIAGLYAWREVISGDDDLTLQLVPRHAVGIREATSYSYAPRTFRAALNRKWRHLQTARYYSRWLRASLAVIPFLQLVLLPLAAFSPVALFGPPLAKSCALWIVRSPQAWMALAFDWILLVVQTVYPIGVWLRRSRW